MGIITSEALPRQSHPRQPLGTHLDEHSGQDAQDPHPTPQCRQSNLQQRPIPAPESPKEEGMACGKEGAGQ